MFGIKKLLQDILILLKEEKEYRQQMDEEKAREERDRLLIEYARKHNKRLLESSVFSSRELADKPIKIGGDLIPFNLSSTEKEILRQFYKRD